MHCGGNRDDELQEQAPPPPFPPGIKTARELINNYDYKSKERKDYRKWYKTYGSGKKSGSKSRTSDARKQIDYLKNLKLPGQDLDMDKAMAKAQGVDVIGDPMEIVAMSPEKKEKMIQAMEAGNEDARQAAAILRRINNQPTAKQKAEIAKRMDLFKKAIDITSPESPDQFAARLGKATGTKRAIAKPSTDSGINESNDNWYNSSLYESLKSKWTK